MSTDRLDAIFSQSCSQFPHNECVHFISKVVCTTFTYHQMNTIVDMISDRLRLLNLNNNEFVAITLDSLFPEIIAALIAVLKNNAAFVFLDISNDQHLYVIRNLNIRYIISCNNSIRKSALFQGKIKAKFIDVFNTLYKKLEILQIDSEKASFYSTTWISDFAFAVFSSGSTGVPKVIRVPHRCILPNIYDLKSIYKLGPADKIYIPTIPTFDPCILDIFLSLSSGSCLITLANDLKFDQNVLIEMFTKTATILCTTPSLFLKTFPKILKSTSLRILTLGGEPFPNLNVETYPFFKSVNVFNIYGITEVSCWACITTVTQLNSVCHLGDPLTETLFEVRNSEGLVIQQGIGELFIGSASRICSVTDDIEIKANAICFRSTGDFVEVNDVKYTLIGRKDRQVKFFGHKVDLSLIERHAMMNPTVKYCYCFFMEEENKIVLLVESLIENPIPENLTDFLKSKLPSRTIIPDVFFVEEIPLNAHGKICRDSCQELYYSIRTSSNIDSSSMFKNCWIKYTKVKAKDINNMGYIDSGGDSMLALQFTTALSNICQIPNNFIVALLSNCNYKHCLELLWKNGEPNQITCQTSEGGSKSQIKSLKGEDPNEKISEHIPKKIKIDPGKLREVRCKGICETFLNVDHVQTLKFNNMQLRWKHNTLKCVDSSPSLLIFEQNALVVCGSHSGKLIIVDVRTGEIHSQLTLPDRIETSACVSPCGKYIFLGCYDQKLYCIYIDSGVIKWSFSTNGMIKCKPTYHKHNLFFGSYDHYFYSLSLDGNLLWKVNIDQSSIYANALFLDDVIIVNTLGGTTAFLNLDGGIEYQICHEKPFFSSPCRISDDLFVNINVTGTLRLWNKKTRTQLWQVPLKGHVFSSVSVIESKNSVRIIFGCYDKTIYCFEVTELEAFLCWQTHLDAAIYATPFSHRYIRDSENHFTVVATISGNIYCINVANGVISEFDITGRHNVTILDNVNHISMEICKLGILLIQYFFH